MQEYIVFLLRVQCRRKESSRSVSHLLMSFLFIYISVLYKLLFLFVLLDYTYEAPMSSGNSTAIPVNNDRLL